MATVLEKIATHVVSRPFFSPLARTRAQQAIVDTIGCMVAGAKDQAPQSVAAAFSNEIGPTGVSGVFTGGRSSLSVAALINGTAAHCLDFDDNFHPARAHASAVLVPALLAVASADGSISGDQLIRAYLAGLEAQAAVGFGVNPPHYNRGWHGTSTVGCIGAAAGVAILLGLDEERVAQAMSIATSLAAGPKGQFGTAVKPLHAGMAARNAVEAAHLAQAGITGRSDILERRQGFLDLFGGADSTGWDSLLWGENHIIETRGLVTKLHPCCASTHRVIDAARDLQNEHGFSLDEVRGIETKVGQSAVDNLAYSDPADEMQARFSMQYCLAAALLQGRLSLADFTRDAIFRPEIRRHMTKISMSAFSAEEERGVERIAHQVTVTLLDGRRLWTERLHAQGAIAAPITEAERHSKFSDCMRWAGLEDDRLYPTWADIGGADSVKSALRTFDQSYSDLTRP
ncbi:MmgE/PrpD family protein [Rhizobium herbae]|uniref:2-methylcitrate dehydratase PrpD n=1 Tax=Rhizobium herbae TaxID=508661 RepID=A0ABS4EW64_9HYPH|nr:MmgE/PrpD family protein [Rhizobium herbae]MBP1862211.1 2-methylcitrate dehydratase PrpD [Rhizobium herbae]